MTEKRVEKWKGEPEELDLDVISTTPSKAPRQRNNGDFLYGNDTVKEFLANQKTPDNPESVPVKVPKLIVDNLPGKSTKWMELQDWITAKNTNLIVQRAKDELAQFIIKDGDNYLPNKDEYKQSEPDLYKICEIIHRSLKTQFTKEKEDEINTRWEMIEDEKKRLSKSLDTLHIELEAVKQENQLTIEELQTQNRRLKLENDKLQNVKDTLNNPEALSKLSFQKSYMHTDRTSEEARLIACQNIYLENRIKTLEQENSNLKRKRHLFRK